MVSICIPTYNNLEAFKRCLDSVLKQKFSDYELIVSDDSTNEEINNYLRTLSLPQLTYLRNTPALGSPSNWNNTLRHAKRKYIKILHHDDFFSDELALGKFVKALETHPKASFAFSYSLIWFRRQNTNYTNKQTRTQLNRLKEGAEFLFFRNVIGAPSTTFFRNQPDILFKPEYKWLVDVDFYIRYLEKYPDFVAIPEALVTVVDGEEGQVTRSVSENKERVITESLGLFAEIYSNKLNTKKAWLFFEELFTRFGIMEQATLSKEFKVPAVLQDFIGAVFAALPKNRFLKALKKRLLTSRYNKTIFKIERF